MARKSRCSGARIGNSGCIVLAVVSVAVAILLLDSNGTTYAQKDHRVRGVQLEIGSYLSGGVTTTAFILTNEGREPFRTTPVCTNYNRLVIVSPDGKRMERFSWKDGIPPVVVESDASQVWSLNLAEMPELKEPGTYRITWKIGEVESEEAVVVRVAEKRNGE
jgi:hypothetical protein